MSENYLLQNQKYYHDEDQNDKDSGTHHHAPFLLGPLSLQNRRTKILDHREIIKAQESACSKK